MILPWDKLVNLALAGYSDIVERLFGNLTRLDWIPDPELALVSELTGDFDNDFSAILADMGMTSYLNGMADPLRSMTIQNVPIIKEWRGDYYRQLEQQPRTWLWDGISFPSETKLWRPVTEKAVAAIKKWDVVKREDFDKLSGIQKSNSWTITGMNTVKAINKIKKSIAQATEDGTGRIPWYKTVKKEFDKSNLGPASAELVFRVAATKTWHEGQQRTMDNPIIGQLFPYVKVYTINDSRRTIACAMMADSGIGKSSIYRRDDPAYINNRTPRHYNCRCRDSVMTVRQAAREGVPEAMEWLKSGVAPVSPVRVPYFEVPMPKGWIPISLRAA